MKPTRQYCAVVLLASVFLSGCWKKTTTTTSATFYSLTADEVRAKEPFVVTVERVQIREISSQEAAGGMLEPVMDFWQRGSGA
jgi:hypothetical protein